jgi:thiol-disulfide isomerase/thioredoxin
MKSSLSMLAAFATVLLLVLLPLLLGCENPSPTQPTQPTQPNHGGCVRPKVIAFTASWCGPCKQAKPYLVQIEARGVEVQIVDIDENPAMARQYGVTRVPTFFVYVCGKKAVRTQDVSVVDRLTRF